MDSFFYLWTFPGHNYSQLLPEFFLSFIITNFQTSSQTSKWFILNNQSRDTFFKDFSLQFLHTQKFNFVAVINISKGFLSIGPPPFSNSPLPLFFSINLIQLLMFSRHEILFYSLWTLLERIHFRYLFRYILLEMRREGGIPSAEFRFFCFQLNPRKFNLKSVMISYLFRGWCGVSELLPPFPYNFFFVPGPDIFLETQAE